MFLIGRISSQSIAQDFITVVYSASRLTADVRIELNRKAKVRGLRCNR
jgi:hypothetical protein